MRVFFLLIGLLLQIGVFAQSEKYYGEFQKLASKDMKLVFEDSFKKDWQKQWFKDGDIAKAVHRNGGLEVYAGDEAYNDAHHTVLWTKKEFEGNIMIEYDNLRKVPAMSTYFRNMNTYHISYAVTGVPSENKDEYIRGRRYMPGNNLNGTDLKPEYYNTGLFKIGVTYHIKVIKYGDQLYMNVTGDGKNETFYFDGSSAPAITKGRIGLRQMFTRNSRYANFKVYSIK